RSILLQRRRKLSRAREILLDPDLSGFILVLNPEKLPIAESRKAVASLKEFDVLVLGLVVNRVLPDEPLGDFLEQRRAQESVYLGTIDEAFHDLDRIRVPLLPHDV